jgi:hypothetical protein
VVVVVEVLPVVPEVPAAPPLVPPSVPVPVAPVPPVVPVAPPVVPVAPVPVAPPLVSAGGVVVVVVLDVVPAVPDVPLGAVLAGSVVVVVLLVVSDFLHAANPPAIRAAINRILGTFSDFIVYYSSFTSILCRSLQVRRWRVNGASSVRPRVVPRKKDHQGTDAIRGPVSVHEFDCAD